MRVCARVRVRIRILSGCEFVFNVAFVLVFDLLLVFVWLCVGCVWLGVWLWLGLWLLVFLLLYLAVL